jgi:hypothetical protein
MMLHLKFVAAIMLLLAGPALASSPPFGNAHHPKPATSAEKDSFSFEGKVAKVDYAANLIVLIADGRRVTVVVEPTTAIDIAGESGSVSDIRPGIDIRAEGVVRKGVFIAQTIAIHSGAKHPNHGPHSTKMGP